MGENYKVDKERQLLDLEHIEIEDLQEIIRNKQIKYYENEIALLDLQSFGLNLNEIGEMETNFVFHFLDNDMINPYTEKKTKNDFLNSFIMTFDNHDEISKSIWITEQVNVGTYDEPKYEIKVRIKDYVLYRRWSSRAIKYWNDKNLNRYINNFRELLEGGLNRADVLKDVIFSDAISDDVSERVKLDSRRQMVDILGLKNTKDNSGVNIFVSGGGREMANSIEDITGQVIDVTNLLDDDE